MTEHLIQSVAARWAKLGVLINVQAHGRTPDLERLLLDTARVASANTRLFVLAAGWLALHGDYVAKHRLARLVLDELEAEHRATLGFMLDWARVHGRANGSRFNLALQACEGAVQGMPLADVERGNAALRRLAERRASVLSRKWGRWMSEFELKRDALRPLEWIARENPLLRERALTGGDLLASVLAEVESAGGSVESEADLARRCGAARPAIRDAVRRLQLAGRVAVSGTRKHAIELINHP